MKTATKFPWLYLLLAYGWTWLWLIPVALTRRDYQSSPLLLVIVFIGIFGPGLAGILLTYREGGREKVDDFWRRALDFRRIRLFWIGIILLLWPAMHLLANLTSKAMGGELPTSELAGQLKSQLFIIPVVIVLYFVQAGLEDLGWRGYMLERVLQRWSPVTSSLLVGISHAFWHIPFFLIVGTGQIKMGFGYNFLLFIFQAVAFSVYATWCYVGNRHSTLSAILLHTTGNLCNDIFTLQPGTMKFPIYTLFMVLGAFAISLVIRKGRTAPLIAPPGSTPV